MKKIVQNISLKALFLIGTILISVLVILGLALCQRQMRKELVDQQMAERWSDKKDAAQISVFYQNQEVDNAYYFRGIEEKINQALTTASISLDTENEGARLWMDAVSRSGKLEVTSELGKTEINAFGVMGDFFQFHPIRMVSGTYFSDLSMMKDTVIIDKETAWQLFGSFDITGMEVKIGDIPHVVVGVFERPKGRMEEAAGLDKPLCYLSIESLEKYGSSLGGYTYEIVLPNPIKKFGVSTVTTAVTADKKGVAVVENSSRYEILPLLFVAKSFGIRSMSKEGIIYPYWENIARGYEDIMAVLLLTELMLLFLLAVIFAGFIIYYYRRKTWSIEQGILWLKEKNYEMGTKRRRKKEEKREENKDEEK